MNILFSSMLICANALCLSITPINNNINNNAIDSNLDTEMRHIYYGDSFNSLTNNSNMPTKATELKYTFGYDLINNTYDTNNAFTYTSAINIQSCASDCVYSNVSGMFAFNFNVSFYGDSSIGEDSDNNSYEIELKKMFQLFYGVYHIENDKVIYDCLYYVKPKTLTQTEINFSNSIYLNLKSDYSYNTCLFTSAKYTTYDPTIACDIVSYNYLGDNVTQDTIDKNNESYNQLLYTNSLSGATCKLSLYNLKTGKFDNTYNVVFSNIAEYDTETYTYKLTYGDLYNYVLSNGGSTDNLTSHQLYFDIDFSNSPLNLSEEKYLSLNKGNNTSTLKLLDKSYTQIVNIPSGSYYDTTTQNISFIRAIISYNSVQSSYIIFSGLTFNDYVNTYYQNGYNDAKSIYTNTITSLSNQLNEKTSENNVLNNQINNLTNSVIDLENEIDLLKSDMGNYTFSDLFFSIASTPFGVLSSVFNVNVLGINLFSVISAIISLLLIIWLVRKLI